MRTRKRQYFSFDTTYYHEDLGDLDVHADGYFTAVYSATLEEPGDGGDCEFDTVTVTDEDGKVLGDITFFAGDTYWLEEEAAENVNGAYDPAEDY